MVLVRQKDKQKPIQLNRKATADTHTYIWVSKYKLQYAHKKWTNIKQTQWHRLTEKGQHKDAIISNTQLINITEIISGWKILILGIHWERDKIIPCVLSVS